MGIQKTHKIEEGYDLRDFVVNGLINSYEGRVRYILKKALGKEYLNFRLLCNVIMVKTLIRKYEDRIKIHFKPFSSFAQDHIITIDSQHYCLVGNEQQFKSQTSLKKLERNDKIDELLR